MIRKSYNIYYYHGLDSFLSDDKKNILKEFGTVTAPEYDYKDPKVLNSINLDLDNSVESMVLIGSSFGDYIATLFSIANNLPCLLFNPALVYRSIDFTEKRLVKSNISAFSYIVLGLKDEVIKCQDNLTFIEENFTGPKEILIENDMAHRVPVDIFAKHVTRFFAQLEHGNPSPG